MATIAQPDTASQRVAPKADPETRLLLRNVPWDVYLALRDAEANDRIRMTYDDGSLELMCPSQRHEEYTVWFGLFVYEIAHVLGFRYKSLRSTTWRQEEKSKGKEADDCFYIANYPRVRRKQIDLRVDPPPDLAVEVEISRSALDALNIYAALGVPEIWRFDGQTFHIHVRQADGSYVERDQSLNLPFLRPDEVVHWMQRAVELDDNLGWAEEVREWARAELVPRYPRE